MYHLDRSVVDERTFGILAALAIVCVLLLLLLLKSLQGTKYKRGAF